jgi:hypothetical protein
MLKYHLNSWHIIQNKTVMKQTFLQNSLDQLTNCKLKNSGPVLTFNLRLHNYEVELRLDKENSQLCSSQVQGRQK